MQFIKVCTNCREKLANPNRSWCQDCYHKQKFGIQLTLDEFASEVNVIRANIKGNNKSSSVPAALRSMVWKKYISDIYRKGKCFCCRNSEIEESDFECGHVISKHHGGPTSLENLRPICSHCNRSMGTRAMDEFIIQCGFWNSSISHQNYTSSNLQQTCVPSNIQQTCVPSIFQQQEYNHPNYILVQYLTPQGYIVAQYPIVQPSFDLISNTEIHSQKTNIPIEPLKSVKKSPELVKTSDLKAILCDKYTFKQLEIICVLFDISYNSSHRTKPAISQLIIDKNISLSKIQSKVNQHQTNKYIIKFYCGKICFTNDVNYKKSSKSALLSSKSVKKCQLCNKPCVTDTYQNAFCEL